MEFLHDKTGEYKYILFEKIRKCGMEVYILNLRKIMRL